MPSKKDKRRRQKAEVQAEPWPYDLVGISQAQWNIHISYKKGIWGQRGVVVTVQNLQTGKKLKRSRCVGVRAERYDMAVELAKELTAELRRR